MHTTLLTRDCPAVIIPAGTAHTLAVGTEVTLTQSLGGTLTVRAPGGLFRIAGTDADALGLNPSDFALAARSGDTAAPVEEKAVWDALRTCFDPEIPVNIVDLGLVYDLVIEQPPGAGAQVAVKMTLTAPGCGMGTVIAGDARDKILLLPGVASASVDVVWDPPWHQSMISPEGRRTLGLE